MQGIKTLAERKAELYDESDESDESDNKPSEINDSDESDESDESDDKPSKPVEKNIVKEHVDDIFDSSSSGSIMDEIQVPTVSESEESDYVPMRKKNKPIKSTKESENDTSDNDIKDDTKNIKCTMILKSGKNKGNICGRENCKMHNRK